jgi:hypothetical protein
MVKLFFVCFLMGIFLAFFLLIRFIRKKTTFGRLFLIVTAYAFCCFVLFYPSRGRINHRLKQAWNIVKVYKPGTKECSCANLPMHHDNYKTKHRPMAIKVSKNGFIDDANELSDLVSQNKLVEANDSDGYLVLNAAHGEPYLIPIARRRLEELGRLYRSYCIQMGSPNDYFVISSMTRTEDQQKIIRKLHKRTATKGKSTHSFGVSFDISEVISYQNCTFSKNALTSALEKMQKEGKILLCPESECIHVTVAK